MFHVLKVLGRQVLEQGAGQQGLQFIEAEHQAGAAVDYEGGTTADHQAGQQT